LIGQADSENNELTVVVGTGYTGVRILDRLSATPAIGLSRSVPESAYEHSVHPLDLDQDCDLPVELPESCSVIYTVPPAEDHDADIRLNRLLDLLTPGPKRLVYISTTGVYGNRDGALVAEDAEARPGSARSRRRLAAEQLLQRVCAQRGIGLVVLRVPGIYGPDRLGLDSIRDGTPVLLEADAYPGNRIYVADLVDCCIRATLSDVPAGIYNVGDGDNRTATWFAHEVARQRNLPPRPEISRARAEKEFSAQRLSFLSESRRIDTRKINEIPGVRIKYANAEDGIKESLAEMAGRG
jgi:nucleoside-diphosphate-sugar epimerase